MNIQTGVVEPVKHSQTEGRVTRAAEIDWLGAEVAVMTTTAFTSTLREHSADARVAIRCARSSNADTADLGGAGRMLPSGTRPALADHRQHYV